MAEKVWALGTDFVRLPGTISYTGGATGTIRKHTAPPGATSVEVVNRSATTEYVGQGHDLTDGAAVDTGKMVTIPQNESRTLDLTGVDAQLLTVTSGRVFYTSGDDLELYFATR